MIKINDYDIVHYITTKGGIIISKKIYEKEEANVMKGINIFVDTIIMLIICVGMFIPVLGFFPLAYSHMSIVDLPWYLWFPDLLWWMILSFLGLAAVTGGIIYLLISTSYKIGKKIKMQKVNNSINKISFSDLNKKICTELTFANKKGIKVEVKKSKEILVEADNQYDMAKEDVCEVERFLRSRIMESFVSFHNPDGSKVDWTKDENSIENLLDSIKEGNDVLVNNLGVYGDIFNAGNISEFLTPLDGILSKINLDIKDINNNIPLQIDTFKDTLNEMYKQYRILDKGQAGEAKVNSHLELFKDVLTNMSNVRIELDNTSVETDNVVITDKGIYALEVKNYGKKGESIVISQDGQWKRYTGYGEEIPINNVLEQHNRHIAMLQRLINSELKNRGYDIDYIHIEPIIVIANDEVGIDNRSDLKVLRASNVYNSIKNHYSSTKLSKEIQDEIINILNKHKKNMKAYPFISYKDELISQFQNIMCDVENNYAILHFYTAYIEYIDSIGMIFNHVEFIKKAHIFNDHEYTYLLGIKKRK